MTPTRPLHRGRSARCVVEQPSCERSHALPKAEEEAERLRDEEEKLKREEERRAAQKPRHNKLDLIALVEHGPEDTASLSKAVESIPKTSLLRIGSFDDYVFEDSKQEEREVADLKKRMSNLVVHARAKVTNSRIYCSAYHPEVTKDLIFFGGMLQVF